MTVPQTRETPGHTGQAPGGSSEVIAATITTVTDLADITRVRAYAAPPCRRRSLWLVVVLACTHCGNDHAHRVGDAVALLGGRIDRTCPATGQPYRLEPVRRRTGPGGVAQ